MIYFTVPCIPIAQPRQRQRVMTSAATGRNFAHNFTPAKHPVQTFKATLRIAAQQAYAGPPLAGPLALIVEFLLPRPQSMMWKKRPMPRMWHDSKPDADNLAKAVKDALSGILWRDDRQIAYLVASKYISAALEQPGVSITVAELSDPIQPEQWEIVKATRT